MAGNKNSGTGIAPSTRDIHTVKRATQKQRRLLQLITENLSSTGKPKSMQKLMVEAGYSKGTAKQPAVITETKSFQTLLNEAGVTDQKISKVMNEGLEASDAKTGKPNHSIRHRYLETAVKVKGYGQEKPSGNTYNTFIQQNNMNPNEISAKKLVDNTLEQLMAQTKATE